MSNNQPAPLIITVVDIKHLELWGKAMRLTGQEVWGNDMFAGDQEFADKLASRLRADLDRAGSATFTTNDVEKLEFPGKSLVTHGITDMIAPGADYHRQQTGAAKIAVGNALRTIGTALRIRLNTDPA